MFQNSRLLDFWSVKDSVELVFFKFNSNFLVLIEAGEWDTVLYVNGVLLQSQFLVKANWNININLFISYFLDVEGVDWFGTISDNSLWIIIWFSKVEYNIPYKLMQLWLVRLFVKFDVGSPYVVLLYFIFVVYLELMHVAYTECNRLHANSLIWFNQFLTLKILQLLGKLGWILSFYFTLIFEIDWWLEIRSQWDPSQRANIRCLSKFFDTLNAKSMHTWLRKSARLNHYLEAYGAFLVDRACAIFKEIGLFIFLFWLVCFIFANTAKEIHCIDFINYL